MINNTTSIGVYEGPKDIAGYKASSEASPKGNEKPSRTSGSQGIFAQLAQFLAQFMGRSDAAGQIGAVALAQPNFGTPAVPASTTAASKPATSTPTTPAKDSGGGITVGSSDPVADLKKRLAKEDLTPGTLSRIKFNEMSDTDAVEYLERLEKNESASIIVGEIKADYSTEAKPTAPVVAAADAPTEAPAAPTPTTPVAAVVVSP